MWVEGGAGPCCSALGSGSEAPPVGRRAAHLLGEGVDTCWGRGAECLPETLLYRGLRHPGSHCARHAVDPARLQSEGRAGALFSAAFPISSGMRGSEASVGAGPLPGAEDDAWQRTGTPWDTPSSGRSGMPGGSLQLGVAHTCMGRRAGGCLSGWQSRARLGLGASVHATRAGGRWPMPWPQVCDEAWQLRGCPPLSLCGPGGRVWRAGRAVRGRLGLVGVRGEGEGPGASLWATVPSGPGWCRPGAGSPGAGGSAQHTLETWACSRPLPVTDRTSATGSTRTRHTWPYLCSRVFQGRCSLRHAEPWCPQGRARLASRCSADGLGQGGWSSLSSGQWAQATPSPLTCRHSPWSPARDCGGSGGLVLGRGLQGCLWGR